MKRLIRNSLGGLCFKELYIKELCNDTVCKQGVVSDVVLAIEIDNIDGLQGGE
ncbi:MAG: hypothetical protein KDB00_00315 [Planctomycetales bacterium]|nr:hypothetical protein [Planctomycetales bacterium]